MRIVLATGNRDKVAELSEMFPGVDVGAAPDGFDVEETGVTLLQNAWIKAAALRGEIADDAWVVADDSGLVVHALGGRPGRVQRPLRRARTPPTPTTAAASSTSWRGWRTGPRPSSASSSASTPTAGCSSRAAPPPARSRRRCAAARASATTRVFLPEGGDRSMAEMTRDEKAAISHRGRAARRLAAVLGPPSPTG